MTAGYQDLSRFKVPRNFRGRPGVIVLLWQLVQATFFAFSPQPLYAWRRTLLRLFGAKIGKGVLVRPSARITYPWKIEIGDYSWIGDNAELYSLGPIKIGANAVVSQKSYLCAATHDYRDITFPLVAKAVVVKDEAWIATDCFIAPGVTIGRGTIIAARSTVLSDIPDGMIAAGTPAAVIGKREQSASVEGALR
jgi:putative colanic acid biosynthesis acetyltransferase WcaF